MELMLRTRGELPWHHFPKMWLEMCQLWLWCCWSLGNVPSVNNQYRTGKIHPHICGSASLGVSQLSQHISHEWPERQVGQSESRPLMSLLVMLSQQTGSGPFPGKAADYRQLASDDVIFSRGTSDLRNGATAWWRIIVWNGAGQQTSSSTYGANNPTM